MKLNILLANIISLLTPKRKIQILLVVFVTLITAIAELASIASVIPFTEFLINIDAINNYNSIHEILKFLNLDTQKEIIFFLTFVFISIFFLSTLLKIILTLTSSRVVYSIGHEMSANLIRSLLNTPYSKFLSYNSAEIVTNVNRAADISGVLQLFINIVVSSIIIFFIIGYLLIIDKNYTIIVIFVFLSFYVAIYFGLKKKLSNNSQKISLFTEKRFKTTLQIFEEFREISIRNIQTYFYKKYEEFDKKINRSIVKNILINSIPGNLIFFLSIFILGFYICSLTLADKGLIYYLPALGALLLGSQKVVPYIQNVYVSISKIAGNYHNIAKLILYLESPKNFPNYKLQKKINFKKNILIKISNFNYKSNKKSLFNNIMLEIKKNTVVGIVGQSGAGKTTFLNILCGFITSKNVKLRIDKTYLNKSNVDNWRALISYVPQEIYLSDASIKENICFGIDDEFINHHNLNEALKIVELKNLINNYQKGLNAQVGERGILLSGGQKQRIGIARALYFQPEILILDESTNALDLKTEERIFNNLKQKKNLTVIIVSHKKTMKNHCDSIYEINNSRFIKIS
jgi:ABC-type bacteriocin/lantibiotic exporter with double-glycine peptidase domain